MVSIEAEEEEVEASVALKKVVIEAEVEEATKVEVKMEEIEIIKKNIEGVEKEEEVAEVASSKESHVAKRSMKILPTVDFCKRIKTSSSLFLRKSSPL